MAWREVGGCGPRVRLHRPPLLRNAFSLEALSMNTEEASFISKKGAADFLPGPPTLWGPAPPEKQEVSLA